MLAQVTKLRVIKLGKRPIAAVAARKPNIPELFFIKIGKRTKGPSAASPSHQDGVQSH